MKNLPLDVLRSFITVTELGGFTQAGELLGRSQPAISLQIKRLEELIDAPVFNRSAKQLELTDAGRTLFDYARKMINLNDEALAQFIRPSVSGKVHFGIPSEFATTLLPKIVGRFTKAYPSVTLEVTCDLSKNLLKNDAKKSFDLILALHDNPSGRQPQGLVMLDDLVWVTSPEYQAQQVATVPIIAAPDGCIYRHRATRQLDKIKQPWRIVYTIPDLTGILAAIEAGLGVTVLAKSTVPDNLQIIKPTETFPKLGRIGISLIYNHRESAQATQRLVDYVTASLS